MLVFTLASMGAGPASVRTARRRCSVYVQAGIPTPSRPKSMVGKLIEAMLRDPAKAGPEFERQLRRQIRYSDGLLLIQEPLLREVIVRPATVEWSVNCSIVGLAVSLGGHVENGTGSEVVLAPVEVTINKAACPAISIAVGRAMLRSITGQ
jgi:hypothetical protein